MFSHTWQRRSATLPADIAWLIVEDIRAGHEYLPAGAFKTLCACSLVSHAWLPIARKALYTHVRLGLWGGNWERFKRTVSSSRKLAGLVRELECVPICSSYLNSSRPRALSEPPDNTLLDDDPPPTLFSPDLVSPLYNLRKIFVSSSCDELHKLSPQFLEALALCSDSLQVLSFHGCQISSPNHLGRIIRDRRSTLRVVHLENIYAMDVYDSLLGSRSGDHNEDPAGASPA